MIERFRQFPGKSFFFVFLLDIPGGKINTEANFIEIFPGEFWGDVLSFLRYLQHDLELMLDIFGEIGMVERLVIFQYRRVRFHENNRGRRNGIV